MIQQQLITSALGTLNFRDFARAGLMLVISAALSAIFDAMQLGGFNAINWGHVAEVAVNSAIGYILLNLGTPGKIMIKNTSQKTIKAIEDGIVKVNVEIKPTAPAPNQNTN